eukprot:CAMPEP_0174384552 /NCGR_PEP_ID=MMETSP0811_2-20130205/125998_1 /TAXON_ID=73025 ORGANISM="Eutreptiella gymnastica-like, Strain CCMP1594" /NCGR_SAMPLE_ID=MMETSP0811_2 /ASSEMBLY_ACC=CAM_ASM_000667 /LENGTH=38 /DNA_ID= /DNA_START= /DNA_END= /DNA_ORIENTATION=
MNGSSYSASVSGWTVGQRAGEREATGGNGPCLRTPTRG